MQGKKVLLSAFLSHFFERAIFFLYFSRSLGVVALSHFTENKTLIKNQMYEQKQKKKQKKRVREHERERKVRREKKEKKERGKVR
jgi:hypothetical protein